MNYSDIDKKYTNVIKNFIENGYSVYTCSMGGSQGDVCKIDLCNEKEVVRVRMTRESGWLHDEVATVTIHIGAMSREEAGHKETLWNDKFKSVKTFVFYDIGSFGHTGRKQWFITDKKEAVECTKKHMERFNAKWNDGRKIFKGDGAVQLVKQYAKRKLGAKRVSGEMFAVKCYCGSESNYYVAWKNNMYKLA